MNSYVEMQAAAGRRIVILIGDFARDGAARQAFLLARELRQRHGLNVQVCSLWQSGTIKAFEAAGIPTRNLCFRRSQCPVVIVRTCYWAGRLLGLAWRLRGERIDILLPFGSWANVIAGLTYRLAGIPHCVWGERAFYRMSGERRAVKNYRYFTANSTAGAEYLVQEFGVARESICIIPNAVEVSGRGSQTDWRARFGLKSGQPLVVMVANVDLARDHATVLRAWKTVQDSWNASSRPMLAFAGDLGNAHPDCLRIVRELRLASSVRFVGVIDDVTSLIRSSDIVLFSSYKEGMPNGVLEAMAEGKPVIASDIPGVRDALGPNAGDALVAPGDAGAFAQRILDMLHDPQKREAMGAANFARACSEFRVERIAGRYLELFDSSLASKPVGLRMTEIRTEKDHILETPVAES